MHIEKSNQWISLIANIGVIVGIIILAIEIRLARDALISATYQARASAVQQWDWNIAESSGVSQAILNLSKTGELEALSEIDRYRIEQINLATFHRLDAFFYQFELGLISEEIYKHAFHAEMTIQIPRLVLSGTFDHPYVKLAMRPSFRREVEKYAGLEFFGKQ